MRPVSLNAPLILVVDDNKAARSLLRETMEEEGYRVAEARDGEQCLTIYTRLRPDIVLLDAVMPVLDGFTCCRQLKALPGGDRIPVLMITGLDDEASVDQAFAAGATDYVTKPIHWAVLRQRVRRLIQASQAMAELHQQTEWEHLMGMISQRIRQSLHLEDILNTTVVEVRQFLQTDRVSIYRFEPDWSGTIAVESVGAEWASLLGKNTRDPCFAITYFTKYKQGHIRAIEDIY
ncbi:MAG TPA: response regulator, partial [Allocoleopsis sp.]